MQYSTTAYAAIVALLSLNSFVSAAPSASVVARQAKNIRLGYESLDANPGKKGASAVWVAGSGCSAVTPHGFDWEEFTPCEVFFTPPGQSQMYTMEGCGSGGGDLKENGNKVGSCKSEEQVEDCGGGRKWVGQYSCTLA
ncbi:hypothetical protein BU24DRAFT_451607 [Aaosphaeria arxii CBS 175.79]|uniref:Small secreted protein n=1 Tax=Aaosphaeria arxii CBS 175.79 TaxID=1450172 RepID=A0A6A5XQN9_9PLEO|nr:uncharacterized protein BU24DRAFT_451607 [Aaosphaeria arxii CBS 175.79]KAF2014614.1 hypothetical protein BU24DRAFT_451607 [Aaosphaeria arxii CBS 175.79]